MTEPKISKVDCRPERAHDRAGEDRRDRDRGVGDDVERRHDRRAVLRRDHHGQRAQRAEEGDAEAAAADHRARPEQGGGVRRGGEHDQHHPRATARATRRPRPPTAPSGRRAAARPRPSRRGRRSPRPVTRWLEVSNSDAESDGPSDRNSPPTDHEEITASAASRNGRRTTAGIDGPLRRQPRARALGDRLGHQQRAHEGDREQHEQRDVGQHARRGRELHEHRRDEHAEPHAAGADDAVGEADARGVAARVQVEHRGRGGAEREAGGDALDAARDEQPRDRRREHEQHRRHEQRAQRHQQHRPAAPLVADAAREHQRRRARRTRTSRRSSVSTTDEKPHSSR